MEKVEGIIVLSNIVEIYFIFKGFIVKKVILAVFLAQTIMFAGDIQKDMADVVLKKCLESDSLSDIDMLECAITENVLTETEFSGKFQKILKSIKDKKIKEKLLESQEAWIKFREKDSEFFAASVKNANMRYVVKLTNMTSMTIKREQEILDSLVQKDIDEE